jgi:hypothetical protein
MKTKNKKHAREAKVLKGKKEYFDGHITVHYYTFFAGPRKAAMKELESFVNDEFVPGLLQTGLISAEENDISAVLGSEPVDLGKEEAVRVSFKG